MKKTKNPVIAAFEKAALLMILSGGAILITGLVIHTPLRWLAVRLPHWLAATFTWGGIIASSLFLAGIVILFAEFLGQGIARHIRITVTFDGKPFVRGLNDYFGGAPGRAAR